MTEDQYATNVEGSGATRSTKPPVGEPVWSYRGYHLGPGEFTTAMVHFFRAEVNRANVWRLRLDSTTNWAVVLTAAMITYTFSGPTGHHTAILLSMLLTTVFLLMETRRYRYYELWSARVRLIETDFFAAMLVPPFHPSPDWAESLAESLLQPHFPISNWEAFGRRLRRNYLWIYIFLGLAWFMKLNLHPYVATSFEMVVERAAIGRVPGWAVILLVVIFLVALMVIALATVGLQEASGEVLPRFFIEQEVEGKPEARRPLDSARAWFRPHARRRELMALVITDRTQAVADHILKDMQRGVTALKGKGMFTGEEHSILMCALTITEANQLKALVNSADPQAFVIVMPAQEILGKGFSPLETA
jgi:uncharacterized membrane protein